MIPHVHGKHIKFSLRMRQTILKERGEEILKEKKVVQFTEFGTLNKCHAALKLQRADTFQRVS